MWWSLGCERADLRGTLLDPGSGSGTGGGFLDGLTLTGKTDAMVVQTSSGRRASSECVAMRWTVDGVCGVPGERGLPARTALRESSRSQGGCKIGGGIAKQRGPGAARTD